MSTYYVLQYRGGGGSGHYMETVGMKCLFHSGCCYGGGDGEFVFKI